MKNTFHLLILSSAIFITHCVPVSTTNYSINKSLIYDDHKYEPIVGLSELYPFTSSLNSDLENPVVELGDEKGMFLQFDVFQQNYEPFTVRYIHCNKNWQPSNLASIRFLDEFNQFNIQNYTYSVNTRRPYVQYNIRLATPKISGNYLVVVSRGSNEKDYILTRKLLVVSHQVSTTTTTLMTRVVKDRNSNQQIDISVNHAQLQGMTPSRDLSLVILQNHRWQNAIINLKPTFQRPDQSLLEYKHFTGENTFPGGNEFRFFDLRSIDFRGMNVANVQKDDDRILAFLGSDRSRMNQAYAQINQDLNGKFYIVDSDPGDSQMMNEYVDVYFELQSDSIEGNVYVLGRYNQWQLSAENRMQYDNLRNSYRAKVRLKQGYFNYCYWVESDNKDGFYFEGSHFQTKNDYEVLVYYRNPINNYDEIVGYESIKTNYY
jgi:hypothetical protein